MANTITIDKFYDTKSYLTPIQKRLIDFLQNGPACRKTLVKELDTPRTTIHDNLIKLQKRKLIEKYGANNGKRGRPLVYWQIKNQRVER